MGYQNEDSLRFVIDIETAPLPDAAGYLEPAEAPSNYKDPAKIEAYCAEKNAENLGRAALDCDLCQIVAVGWQREDWNEPVVLTLDSEPNGSIKEAALLADFWGDLHQHATIGYNTLGFDLPVLLRRSLYLGIQHPFVNIDKYRTNHIDLQMRLSYNGAIKFRPLSFYCRRFGIPCDDETSGKDIGAFVAAGEWDKVAAHCRADVLKTKALAERMGLIKANIDQPEMVL
jgi:hypothetical protein